MNRKTPTLKRLIIACGLLVTLGINNLSLAQEEQVWTVNFKETDIRELIRFVADATGKTMVIDTNVKGNVQVISSKALNQTELYRLFLSILDVNGFSAVESGDVVRVIPAQDARTAPVPVLSNISSIDAGIVTQVIQLKNVSASKLVPVLRPLVAQQGQLAAYAPSNAIIINDSAANIARIRQIIDQIDTSAQSDTEVFPLTYASATEVVSMLEELQNNQPQTDETAETAPLVMVPDGRTNSIIVSGADLERERIKDMIERLDTPLAQTGNVRVIYLKYADATDMATLLNSLLGNVETLTNQTGPAGANAAAAARTTSSNSINSVVADEGTNSLVITADTDVMQSLQAVIDRLDIRRAQVLVEAIIVEITDVDAKDLGLQWLFLDSNGGYVSNSAASTSNTLLATTSAGAAALIDADTTNDLTLGQALASTPGGILGFADSNDTRSFNVVLNALEANTDANILSTPSLLTMDNQEASITVGQNVPFVTGSYSNAQTQGGTTNPFQTIQREDVGITLKVTPHINDGNTLVLDIDQEVSSLTGAASTYSASDIITNERTITTKVTTADGQIIVLGGLIEDQVQDNSQKVPVLGDIPVLGRLFRYSSVSNTKRHLMVFLRSTIIPDDNTLTGATAQKYNFIRDNQKQKTEEGVDLMKDADLPLLPEWQEQIKNSGAAESGSSSQQQVTQ